MVELFIHRYFSEDSRAICSRLCYSLLGYIYRLYFTIQYYNEVGFLGKLFIHCVVHEASQNCAQILWQRPGYFSSHFPCVSLPGIGSCYTWEVYLQGGMDASLSLILAFNFCCSISDVDIIMLLGCASTFSLIGIFIIKDMWLHFLPDNVDLFHILGSCCHPSSAGLVAENEKYRQLDWTIHFTLGVMYLSFLTFCKSWLCSHLNLFTFFFFFMLFTKGFYLGFFFVCLLKWKSQFLFIHL